MAVTNQVYRGIEGVVKKVPTELLDLGPKDILVKITHSGLCGTDTAYVPYGIALGHEGVGIVVKVGEAVQGRRPSWRRISLGFLWALQVLSNG